MRNRLIALALAAGITAGAFAASGLVGGSAEASKSKKVDTAATASYAR